MWSRDRLSPPREGVSFFVVFFFLLGAPHTQMQFHHPLSSLFMFARSSGATAHRAELQRETERLAALPRPSVRWFDAAESLAFVEPVVRALFAAKATVGHRRMLEGVFRARSAWRAWRAHVDGDLMKHLERALHGVHLHLHGALAAFTDVFALRCDDVGLMRAVHRWIGVCETPTVWAAMRRVASPRRNRAAAWLCGVLHVAPRRLVKGAALIN